ncbi:MAG: hypothetical protein ABI221_01990 [Candidatus Saccharimonadales bacterium]
MKKFTPFSRIKKFVKNHKIAAAAATAAILLVAPLGVKAAWGPGRPVYDYNKAPLNGSTCVAADDTAYNRCGSMTGPVFNSFTNTPSYGDERDFVQVSPNGSQNFTDDVTAKPGDTISVRVYVHNNANQNTNESGLGIAKNTNVRVYLPTGSANGFDIAGYVSASNAKQARVYDTGRVTDAGQKVSLSYVPGSAKIYNDGPWKNGVALPDAVVSDAGTPIGYNALNGDLPGCFNYRAVIILQVKVQAPALQFTKQVTTPGSSNWGKSVSVKKGDTTSWLLSYKNTGTAEISDVTLRDQVPAGLKIVPGSITWYDQYHANGEAEADTSLNSGGLNIGNALPGGGGYIRFRTVVNADDNVCQLTNMGYARSAETPEQSDTATVNITDCQPTVPNYTCNLMTVNKVSDKTYKFTVAFTALNGATFKDASFDFGDGNTILANKLDGPNTISYSHTYAANGSFSTKATLRFTVNGQDKTAAVNAACAKPVAVTQQNCTVPGKENLPVDSPDCVNVPPVTPATPTTLVNTGPGDVAAIFAVTTLAGAMAYRLYMARRLSRQ